MTTGNDALTEENIAKITAGTPKQDVVSMIGEPQTKMQMPMIGEMWIYSCSAQTVKNPGFLNIFESSKSSVTARSISIIFDDQGLVKTCSSCINNPSTEFKIKKL